MTGSTGSNAETRKPLQFSLRFVLGVVTGVAVFCAIVKTAGAVFWRFLLSLLVISCGVAAYVAALSLLAIVAISLLPHEKGEREQKIRRLCNVFSWAVIWCLVAGLIAAVFSARVT